MATARGRREYGTNNISTRELAIAWKSSAIFDEMMANMASKQDQEDVHDYYKNNEFHNSYFEDLQIVTKRQFSILYGDRFFYYFMLGQLVFTGIMMSALFFEIPLLPASPTDRKFVIERYMATFFSLFIFAINSMGFVPLVLFSRQVFYKQRDEKFHRTSTYVLANAASSLVTAIPESLLMSSLVFFSLNLVNPKADDVGEIFILFVLISYMANLAYGSVVKLISFASPSPTEGVLFVALFLAR